MSEPNGGFNDSGASSGGDAGILGVSPVESADSVGTPEDGGISGSDSTNQGGNRPWWNEVLDTLPREYHPGLQPHLQKFDKNYNSLAQQYAPWKKTFSDKGITSDDLQQAYSFYQMTNSNPQEVYRRLGELLGVSTQQAQQYVQNEQQQGYDGQEYEPDQEGQDQWEEDQNVDPRLAQLMDQVQQQQQYIEQQVQWQAQQEQQAQYQHMENSYAGQIDNAMKELLKRDPSFDVNDVLQRAYVQVAQGQEIDLGRAYNEHIAFVNRIRSAPRNTAPTVMPTGGGLPPTIDNSRPQTNDEKAARVKQMIEAAIQG